MFYCGQDGLDVGWVIRKASRAQVYMSRDRSAGTNIGQKPLLIDNNDDVLVPVKSHLLLAMRRIRNRL